MVSFDEHSSIKSTTIDRTTTSKSVGSDMQLKFVSPETSSQRHPSAAQTRRKSNTNKNNNKNIKSKTASKSISAELQLIAKQPLLASASNIQVTTSTSIVSSSNLSRQEAICYSCCSQYCPDQHLQLAKNESSSAPELFTDSSETNQLECPWCKAKKSHSIGETQKSSHICCTCCCGSPITLTDQPLINN